MSFGAVQRGGAIGLACVLALALVPARASAQVAPAAAAPATPAWQWTWDGSLFLQYNYQQRKFTDFWAVESQNWLMGTARRATQRSTVEIAAMASFESFTLQDLGSPQVFQTGETFGGAPLIDYQHPHDLTMQLGARYDRLVRGVALGGSAAVAGAPAFGPPVFMHRASADANPTAPLAHHHLDSMHITPGVLTGRIGKGAMGAEASAFHGREPDEDRLDLDLGPLDSWSVRGSWTHGRWSAQLSGASVTSPEALEPDLDATRLSASIAFGDASASTAFSDASASTSFSDADTGGRFAALAAWGQMRDSYGRADAYLVEAAWHPTTTLTWYARAESVVKNILTAGPHPPGFTHAHEFSRVGAFTIGVRREVRSIAGVQWLAGGDVTGHRTPPNLQESYGQPWSYRVYLQLRRATHRHR